jgi:hypothetical protein
MNCIRGVWSGSDALPRSLSWLAGVLSTLPNPRGLTLVPVPVAGRSTSPYRRPLHTKRKCGFGALCGRGRERVAFHASAAECTAPRTPSQISPLLRRFHFELKQLGFTAAYRARQCLLTSRNTFISIRRAGLLLPHGSESGTWHNRDLIRRHARADASRAMARPSRGFSSQQSRS